MWTKSIIEYKIPDDICFLTRETRYPIPVNSKSMPEIVVSKQVNCAWITLAVEGPEDKSNLAFMDPRPPASVLWDNWSNRHKACFVVGFLQFRSL